MPETITTIENSSNNSPASSSTSSKNTSSSSSVKVLSYRKSSVPANITRITQSENTASRMELLNRMKIVIKIIILIASYLPTAILRPVQTSNPYFVPNRL